MELTREIAAKVLGIVDHGLSHGLGTPEPGKLCVEAAVCLALGLPHGDNPPCVGYAVRSFKIRLNDSKWSSPEARAVGMRRLAIAQLGSDQVDQKEFVRLLAGETIRQIVPIALRAAASIQKDTAHAMALEIAALRCKQEGTKEAAIDAKAAAYAAYAADAAAAAAYANAAAYAAADAAYAADAAADAADADADAYANAAAYAADAAADAADAADADADATKRNAILTIMANIAVNILCKLGSQGCQWLDLCQ